MRIRRWVLAGLVSVVAVGTGAALGVTLGREGTVSDSSMNATDESVSDSPHASDAGSDDASDAGSDASTISHLPASGSEFNCSSTGGQPFVGGPETTLSEIGEADGMRVYGGLYPRPSYEGDPWTQWGQGVVTADGTFYSAIGDHLGPDGNSYIYEFDPGANHLAMVGDVLSYVDHDPGSWGYGKIHGQMVLGSCDDVFFSTYWGTNRGLVFSGSYEGDVLFRLDPDDRTIENLGVPVPFHGVPSLAGSMERGLVYGEAIDPVLEAADNDQGPFFAYDSATSDVKFLGSPEPHEGFRNIIVDAQGMAYYSIGNGQVEVYDPVENNTKTLDDRLPGEVIRASTSHGPDGKIYGVTDDEGAFFVLDPAGPIEPLGFARGYTTTLALHPEGTHFYYMPDAHGGAYQTGAPIISVDTATGDQTELIHLNPMAERALRVRVGGTYGMAVSPGGERLYIGANVAPLDIEGGFGEVALLVVDLP